MSAAVLSSTYSFNQPVNYSRRRKARLARTLVVLSLTLLLTALIATGYSMSAGAGEQKIAASKYVTLTVAPGETLWSILSKFDGDTRSMIDQVITINSLKSADVEAGQQLRIPLNH